jgi:hypothetical protein
MSMPPDTGGAQGAQGAGDSSRAIACPAFLSDSCCVSVRPRPQRGATIASSYCRSREPVGEARSGRPSLALARVDRSAPTLSATNRVSYTHTAALGKRSTERVGVGTGERHLTRHRRRGRYAASLTREKLCSWMFSGSG